jgi:hypothetical protein
MSSLLYSLVCEKYDLILLSLQQLAKQYCFRHADEPILEAFSCSQSKKLQFEEAGLAAFLEQKVMLAGGQACYYTGNVISCCCAMGKICTVSILHLDFSWAGIEPMAAVRQPGALTTELRHTLLNYAAPSELRRTL